jgi:excisionase family DNA binding protein
MMKHNELMTLSETADLLRLRPGTVQKMCQAGTIPHIAVNRRTRLFDRRDIDAWLSGKKVKPRERLRK